MYIIYVISNNRYNIYLLQIYIDIYLLVTEPK